MLDLITTSPADTQKMAAELAGVLQHGDMVLLEGDLGSGKTVFCQGLAGGLGVSEAVISPTFALAHHYSGRLSVRHLDLYRLDNPEEMREFVEEELPESVVIVEWGDKLIFQDFLKIKLMFADCGARYAGGIRCDSVAGGDPVDLRRLKLSWTPEHWHARQENLKAVLLPWRAQQSARHYS